MSQSPEEQFLADLPVEQVQRVVENQYNLVELIKSWFDVDDDSLAVLIATQVRLAQMEQRENELLNAILSGGVVDIPDPPDFTPNIEVVIDNITPEITLEEGEEDLSVTVEGLSIDEDAIADAMEQSLLAVNDGRLLTFPDDGREFSFPAGSGAGSRHEIKLDEGEVDVNGVGSFDISDELTDLAEDRALSAQFWADDEIVIRIFDTAGELAGIFNVDQGYVTVDSTVIERAEIDAARPFNLRAQFSTAVQSPVTTAPTATHQRRYGHVTTSDGNSFTAIPFVGPNPADYGEANLNDAADNFGDQDLFGANIGQHSWIVQNVSGNSAEVQARMFDINGEQQAADNDIHGSVDTGTGNTITIAGNDFAVLESNLHAQFFRLLALATTDTNQIELEVQYAGFSPGMRGS